MQGLKIHAAVLISVFSAFFAAAETFSGKVTFRDQGFTSEQLSNSSMVIFPFITLGSFDTTESISDSNIAVWLNKKRSDIKTVLMHDCFFEETEPGLKKTNSRYSSLVGHLQKELQADSSFWRQIKTDYAFALYIISAGRIKDQNGTVKRKLQMEAEIWSVNPPSIVWRCDLNGFEKKAKVPDSKFFKTAAEKIFSMLPPFKPTIKENDW